MQKNSKWLLVCLLFVSTHVFAAPGGTPSLGGFVVSAEGAKDPLGSTQVAIDASSETGEESSSDETGSDINIPFKETGLCATPTPTPTPTPGPSKPAPTPRAQAPSASHWLLPKWNVQWSRVLLGASPAVAEVSRTPQEIANILVVQMLARKTVELNFFKFAQTSPLYNSSRAKIDILAQGEIKLVEIFATEFLDFIERDKTYRVFTNAHFSIFKTSFLRKSAVGGLLNRQMAFIDSRIGGHAFAQKAESILRNAYSAYASRKQTKSAAVSAKPVSIATLLHWLLPAAEAGDSPAKMGAIQETIKIEKEKGLTGFVKRVFRRTIKVCGSPVGTIVMKLNPATGTANMILGGLQITANIASQIKASGSVGKAWDDWKNEQVQKVIDARAKKAADEYKNEKCPTCAGLIAKIKMLFGLD